MSRLVVLMRRGFSARLLVEVRGNEVHFGWFLNFIDCVFGKAHVFDFCNPGNVGWLVMLVSRDLIFVA